jgi:hypothetical protein
LHFTALALSYSFHVFNAAIEPKEASIPHNIKAIRENHSFVARSSPAFHWILLRPLPIMSDRTSIEKEKFSITENVRAAAPDEISAAADMSEGAIKRVLRKMDIHLLPFVSLLYLLSFLYVNFSANFVTLSSLIALQGPSEYRQCEDSGHE